MITKIDLYNAPYEINSVDRFYKEIDTKLASYKAGAIKEFSFTISSTTDLEITVDEATGTRGSYARIESSIFPDKNVSYWFLTEISGVESSEDTRYKAKLDAIATFGEDVFNVLDGKKLKIDRLHEDRYVIEGGSFVLNKKHHGLINTDFKVGDTKGMELVFDGNNEDRSKTLHKMYVSARNLVKENADRTQLALGTSDVQYEVDNRIQQQGKTYYLYALLQLGGEPIVVDKSEYSNASGSIGNIFFNSDVERNRSAIRQSVIVPINNSDINVPNKDQDINSLTTISKLQEGKVLNILKIPYKIRFDGVADGAADEGIQILFSSSGSRIRRGFDLDTSAEDIYNSSGTIDKNYHIYNSTASKHIPGRSVYEIIAFKSLQSYGSENVLSIPTGKLEGNAEIMEFIVGSATPQQMKDLIIDKGETERLEIALLNPEIMPIQMYFEPNPVILDFYNFANRDDKSKILGSYTLNEMGLETTLELSDNQFVQWSENTIMSFNTDQGSTYLARNKYSNDAAKTGIDLQAKQAEYQAHLQKLQGQAQAGNIVSGIFSLGASTAAGTYQANYAGKVEDLQPGIAANKKAQIQASIDDASATSPSVHTGTTHNLSNLNIQEYDNNFNWVMKKPNKFLRDKIVNFYDRHGYMFNDWVLFTKDMVNNRSRYNFIEMAEFKDFLGTFKSFDINVLQLLDAEFKKGLRLWHEPSINYNTPNLEKIIVENI